MINTQSLKLFLKIKILQWSGPNYEEEFAGVRTSKGKKRSIKKYLGQEEIERAELKHEQKIKQKKDKYNFLYKDSSSSTRNFST